MASLTDTSIIARKIIRYGIYTVIIILIARFAFRTAVDLYRRLFPPPPPAPTVKWGKLPTLPFPEKDIPEKISYKLETVDGKLPDLVDQERIYFMPAASSSINIIDEAKAKAKKLGFNPKGKPVVETIQNVYVFNRTQVPSNLTMNIITGIFSISYDLNSDPTPLGNIPPSSGVAIDDALDYLGESGVKPKDLGTESARHIYLKIQEREFTKALSQSDADIILVNLFRIPYGKNDLPSVTHKYPNRANVWFMMTGSGGVKRIIAAEFHYYPVDKNKFSTYPLITSEEAWNQLRDGKGYVANYNPDISEVIIRKIYLAYYDAGQYVEFYQPVIVFEGDNDFAAFVPAITAELYGAEDKKEE